VTVGTPWRNWTGDQACAPAAIVAPRDKEELAAALARARDRGLRVRVAGAGHSFNDAVLTDGLLVSLHRMDRVLDADPDSQLARVEAGIALNVLSETLDGSGMALENLGDIAVQSLAGATSTGTHGTGAAFRNLSANITEIEMMRADGSTVRYDENTPHELRAARIGLGSLGVVTEITVRTVPAFTLRGVDKAEPLGEVLASLDERVASNDHFEFYAFPHSKRVWTRTNNRVDQEPRPRSRSAEWFRDTFLVNTLYGAVCKTGRRVPRLIPSLNRMSAALSGAPARIDRSYKIFASPRSVRFTESEYGIPRDRAANCLRTTLEMIEKNDYAVPIPLEVRFVAADDTCLSPSHQRDTCYVSAHMFEGMEWGPYFRSFRDIARDLEGRPHWGKRHEETAESLAPLYPEWERFQRLRTELDPDGTFANGYIRRVLGVER
jgi:L-gulonolactone oxidase